VIAPRENGFPGPAVALDGPDDATVQPFIADVSFTFTSSRFSYKLVGFSCGLASGVVLPPPPPPVLLLLPLFLGLDGGGGLVLTGSGLVGFGFVGTGAGAGCLTGTGSFTFAYI